MDLGNIVYILAVLAYFIYQATRNKKQTEEGKGSLDVPEAKQQPTSFEDLLKEIREAQKPKRPVQPTVQKTPEPKPYSTTSYQPEPEVPFPTAKRASWYDESSQKEEPETKETSWYGEKPDEEIKYYEGAYERKVAEMGSKPQPLAEIPTLEIKRTDHSDRKVNPYAQLLKNPKSVRDAVILSEILKRKEY